MGPTGNFYISHIMLYKGPAIRDKMWDYLKS